MKKSILLLIFLGFNYMQSQISAEKMPLYFEPIPTNVDFKFIKSDYILGEEIESELYSFTISDFPFILIKTDGIDDCLIINHNNYGGGEIYKKLDDDRYQRIVEIRKQAEKYSLYYVDDENNSKKILSVNFEPSQSNMYSILAAYALYWKGIKN